MVFGTGARARLQRTAENASRAGADYAADRDAAAFGLAASERDCHRDRDTVTGEFTQAHARALADRNRASDDRTDANAGADRAAERHARAAAGNRDAVRDAAYAADRTASRTDECAQRAIRG